LQGPCTDSIVSNIDVRPEVKITMTKDMGKILSAMHSVKISGKPNLMSALQIAQVRIFL